MKVRSRWALILLIAGPIALCGQDTGQNSVPTAAAPPSEASPSPTPPPATELLPNPDSLGVYYLDKLHKSVSGLTFPKVVKSRSPEFSDEARRKKLSGVCSIGLIAGPDGNPRDVHVVRSIAEGLPENLRAAALSLDESAVKVVKQYRFQPATLEGKPVPVSLTVEVNFRIY